MPKIESSDTAVTITYDDNEIKETSDYWTEERINSARPVELPTYSDEEFQKIIEQSKDEASTSKSKEIVSGGPLYLSEGQVTEANVTEQPYSNGGKLFFTYPNGLLGTCTAEAVANECVLLTAAHCVQDGNSGEMNKNFMFYRGFGGPSPQKVGIKIVKVSPHWAKPLNPAFDYAFLKTNTAVGGSSIGFWIFGSNIQCTAIGYPQNFFDGQKMSSVNGSSNPVSSGIVQMKNNPLGHGASGGAWILTPTPNGGGFVIGLNSFRPVSETDTMYGPFLGEKWSQLWEETLHS